MTSTSTIFEFARADKADDPYAFDFGVGDYLIRTQGGGFRATELRWTDELLDQLDELRAPNCDPSVVQHMGNRLQRFLKPADFARHEANIVRSVENGEPVYITIRSAAAELYALPWELLTLRSTGQHLGELPEVLIRYTWPETRTTPIPRPRGDRERVLFAWSAAGGRVPADKHQALLHGACTRGLYSFDPNRDVLPDVSIARLDDALSASAAAGEPIAVLHLLCHGAAQGDTFGLKLDRDQRGGVVVDPGRLRQLFASHASYLRMVVLCACDSGNIGALGNQLGSVAQNIHTAGIRAVIGSRFPLSVTGSIQFSTALYGALLSNTSSLEHAFLTARKQLARDASSLDWASVQLFARPEDGDDTRPFVFRPYRGLLPFRAEHTRFFFGRDAEQNEIISDLQALIEHGKPRLLVVAGASGTGKSSVVMAGALPRLTEHDQDEPDDVERDLSLAYRALDVLQGKVANESMRQGVDLIRSGLAEMDGNAAPRWEIAIMRLGKQPMESLDRTLATRRDPMQPFLLVIDQFEELFTGIEDAKQRELFVRRLWGLCRELTGVHAIITIRVDFLGACGDVVLDETGVRLDQVAYDEAHRVFVAQMGPEQLREAIERPARLVGLTLDHGLASTMLSEVGAEPGALPLLQYTLDLLWQRREGRRLTADTYHELGGVTGALQRKADGLIDSFDESRQRQARRMLVRLVGVESKVAQDTRRRVPLEHIRPNDADERAAFEEVFSALVSARLLVRNEEGGHPTVEIAHEALIRKWERLRIWLHEDRDKLGEISELSQWVEQWHAYGTLIRDAQLGYAVQVRDKYQDDLDADMLRMIDASIEHTEREQKRIRTRVRGAIITLIVFVITASSGLLYSCIQNATIERQSSKIEEEKARAEENAQVAEENAKAAEENAKTAEENERQAEENAEKANNSAREAKENAKRASENAARAAESEEQALAAQKLAERRAREALEQKRLAIKARREAETAKQIADDARREEERLKKRANDLAKKEKERADRLEKRLRGGMIKEMPGVKPTTETD